MKWAKRDFSDMLLGGLGISVLVFVFGIAPGTSPVSVMLIILAVAAASTTPGTTGGLDLLARYAERLLRRYPDPIVYLGPYGLLENFYDKAGKSGDPEVVN